MRHRASKIDFRRLAGEVEDSESDAEVEQASTARKSIVTSPKYHLGDEKRDKDDEYPKDACVCCHQVNRVNKWSAASGQMYGIRSNSYSALDLCNPGSAEIKTP